MPDFRDAAAVVIPARYASSRLPAKALADIAGKSMISRVWQRACLAKAADTVIVATDDVRIRDAVGTDAVVSMTDPAHETGSDRIAEVARDLPHGIIVNVQGDMPLLDPSLVDRLIERLRSEPELGMATVAYAVTDPEEFADPSAVKVVCDTTGRALYFSRAAIPHNRDEAGDFAHALHHVGLYAYRRETLFRFAELAVTPLERTEKLEQLRALENGIVIGVVVGTGPRPIEVDTPADLAHARAALEDPASQETTN